MGREILRLTMYHVFSSSEASIPHVRPGLSDNPDFADRPSNLTFNLDPIVGKLKTQPIDFEQQLEELTHIEPLRG